MSDKKIDSKKKNMVDKSPEIINLKNRRHFIEEVALTIRDNHAKHNESFIFGISGKWGEGKTTFLDELESKLEEFNEHFEIFRVNPWKFSSDKISFLRTFLKQLSTTKPPFIERFRNWINNHDAFRNIDYDISENKIHPGFIIVTFLWLSLIVFCYEFLLPINIKILVGKWQVITVIGIPLLIALIGKIISIQRSSKTISTIDRFDNLLDDVLKNKSSKKIIVFLDDLDRVTPQKARDVLDNLRTFFDRRDITFVVTGDHSVLERHLGRELLPEANPPSQLEEGRRFLKKIFNVYWRLPLPIESELDTFLENQFSKQSESLNKILSEDNQKILKKYLKDYFERNFRQILRFLETILFTFRIIQNKKKSSEDKQEKKYFEELAKHPLLVIRILTIQELCAPLFEKFLESHEIFRSLEHAVEIKNQVEVDKIINSIELSPTQKKFINNFLFQEPRFYKNSSLVVSDLRPFLHLAADASFGDERGPSSYDFVQIITAANPKAVKGSLLLSGDGKLSEAAKAFLEKFNETTDSLKKKELMDTLIGGLSELDYTYSVHGIFFKEISPIELTFYKDIEAQTRIPAQLAIWKWLDGIKDSTDSWIEKFPFLHQQDFDQLKFKEEEKVGVFTTNVIMRWFNQYYGQDKLDALSKIESILPHLDLRVVRGQVDAEKLSEDLIINQNDSLRLKLLNVLNQYSNKGMVTIKSKLFDRLKTYDDQNLWQWAISQAGGKELWTKKELELTVINSISSINDDQSLIRILRFAVTNIQEAKNELWQEIVNNQLDRLVTIFPQIIDDNLFQPIAPDIKNAEKISSKIITRIKNLPDDNQKIQWLEYIKKEKWIWTNLQDKPNRKKFGNMNKAGSEALKQKIVEVIQSWE